MKWNFQCWVFVLCGCLLFFSGCARQLQSGLSEDDAQQIVVLLRQNGISAGTTLDPSAKKDAATWMVSVQGGNETVVRAWKILHENGLPRKKEKGLEEVFANAGMIPTASEEKARLLSGMDGELTRTLNTVAGVVSARVQVVLPEISPLLDKNQQASPTASVLIQYQGERRPLSEEEIRSLVAKGVEGLAPADVAVVFKKLVIVPIPIETYGPFSRTAWLNMGGLALSAITTVLALLVLSLSQQRKYKIKSLEKQLAQFKDLASRGGQVLGGL